MNAVRKKYRRWLIVVLIVNLIVLAGYGFYYYKRQIPKNIRIRTGEEERFSMLLPFSASFVTDEDSVGVLEINHQPLEKGTIKIELADSFSMKAMEKTNATVELRLFGVIPLRKVEISAVTPQSVVVGGSAIGIHVETDGVLVLGTTTVTAEDKTVCEPCKNRLHSGDYLLKVNGTVLSEKEDLVEVLKKSAGEPLRFQIRRNGEIMTTEVKPVRTGDGSYKIGAWIRDDTQGIGTLTFITQDGYFGALGHGITDVDTGGLIRVGDGDCYLANILRVVPGRTGNPGEMSGFIRRNEDNRIGTVKKNTSHGIFGTVKEDCVVASSGDCYEVGLKREIMKGPACILCELDGTVERYEIEIEKVDYANNNHAKGLVIRVTDERLLTMTGGIVQGMSGSPILQNDKLIGAVTHVFISNPQKGYGILIEDMLAEIEELKE